MSLRHDDRDDDQTMADTTAVPQKQRSVGGRSGNQTAMVTVEGDGGNLITDEVAWTENQDGGDAEMESDDGGSDLKQNSKVCSPNLKAVSQSVDLGQNNNPNTTPTKDYEIV